MILSSRVLRVLRTLLLVPLFGIAIVDPPPTLPVALMMATVILCLYATMCVPEFDPLAQRDDP